MTSITTGHLLSMVLEIDHEIGGYIGTFLIFLHKAIYSMYHLRIPMPEFVIYNLGYYKWPICFVAN